MTNKELIEPIKFKDDEEKKEKDIVDYVKNIYEKTSISISKDKNEKLKVHIKYDNE